MHINLHPNSQLDNEPNEGRIHLVHSVASQLLSQQEELIKTYWSNIHQKLFKVNNKETTQLKNGRKIWTDTSPKGYGADKKA